MRLYLFVIILVTSAPVGAAPVDSLTPLPPLETYDAVTEVRLSPYALTADQLGRLWILDTARGRLMLVDENDGRRAFAVAGGEDGTSAALADLAVSGSFLYILEPTAPSVVLLDLDGHFRERVDLSSTIEDAGRLGFLASRMLVGRSGDLWLIDITGGRLLHLDRRGRFLDTPLESLTGDDRPGRIADAALGPDDSLFLLDAANARIVTLSPDGVLMEEDSLAAPVEEPAGLAVDRSGNRYVIEAGGRIRIISSDGVLLIDLSSRGLPASSQLRACVIGDSILCRSDPAHGTIHRWLISRVGSEDAKR